MGGNSGVILSTDLDEDLIVVDPTCPAPESGTIPMKEPFALYPALGGGLYAVLELAPGILGL